MGKIPKGKKTYEVKAIVAEGVLARQIDDKELFELREAFHRQIEILREEDGKVIIFTLSDQYLLRLRALLPFMPAFKERRVIIDPQVMIKRKLNEPLNQTAN